MYQSNSVTHAVRTGLLMTPKSKLVYEYASIIISIPGLTDDEIFDFGTRITNDRRVLDATDYDVIHDGVIPIISQHAREAGVSSAEISGIDGRLGIEKEFQLYAQANQLKRGLIPLGPDMLAGLPLSARSPLFADEGTSPSSEATGGKSGYYAKWLEAFQNPEENNIPLAPIREPEPDD